LQGLVRHLADEPVANEPLTLLATAARLGGVPVSAPAALETSVAQRAAAFLADEGSSKPLGFYTWSSELEAIFRQDRLLQTEIERDEDVRALGKALRDDPALAATYDAYLALIARLT